MAEFEVKLRKKFTVMSNHHLQNKILSLKAKGLLSYMLSLPKDWDYSIGGLASNSKEGRAAVRSALNELEEAKYLIRKQVRSNDGNFGENQYIVYEIPYDEVYETPQCENCTTDNGNEPLHAKKTTLKESEPLCENCTTVEEKAPLCGFPSSDNPPSENRTQLNTNKQNTNIPPISPKGERAVVHKDKALKDRLFEQFWEKYPNHKNKQAAKKKWDRLKPSTQLFKEIMDALSWMLKTFDWTKENGRFVPHASTWLNQKRWLDEREAYSFYESNEGFDKFSEGMAVATKKLRQFKTVIIDGEEVDVPIGEEGLVQ